MVLPLPPWGAVGSPRGAAEAAVEGRRLRGALQITLGLQRPLWGMGIGRSVKVGQKHTALGGGGFQTDEQTGMYRDRFVPGFFLRPLGVPPHPPSKLTRFCQKKMAIFLCIIAVRHLNVL